MGRWFVLDSVVPALRSHAGRLHGFRDEGATVIVSTAERSGLIPVATTQPNGELPLARADGDPPTITLADGGLEHVEVLRMTTDYGARLAGIVDSHMLAEKHVLIIAAGSLGLPIALHLARCGVGRMAIVDPDVVSLENLSRTGFVITQLGKSKALAAQELILRANPAVDVLPSICVFHDLDDDSLDDADLIVAAASDVAAHEVAARAHSRTAIIAPAAHARAASGEVFVSLGRRDAARACFTCFRGSMTMAHGRTWNYASADHELAAEPGLGPDVAHITSIAASIAVNVLAGTPERVLDPNGGQVLFCSHRAGGLLAAPFESVWVRVPRHPDCPNHGDAP